MGTLTYADPNRSRWLGSTDIVALAGLSHWRTPIGVWEEKVAGLNGKAPQPSPEPEGGPVLLALGKHVEPFIARRYEMLDPFLNVTVRINPLARRDVPYFACSPDFLVRPITAIGDIAAPPFTHGLETKMVLFSGHRAEELETWGEEGTDQVPQDYLIQCQWCLAVTGLPRWDLAALWYGTEIKRYTILPQPELMARLKEIADDFWKNHVLTFHPPKPDGSKEYSRFLAKSLIQKAEPMRFDLDNDPAYQDEQLRLFDMNILSECRSTAFDLRMATAAKEAAWQKFAMRFGTLAKVRCGAQEYSIRTQTRTTTDWKGIVQAISHELDPALFEEFTKEGQPYLVTTIRQSPKQNKE